MRDKTPPPRLRPPAKGRDEPAQRNGLDPSRRPAPEEQDARSRSDRREQPVQPRDVPGKEVATSAVANEHAAGNGNRHRETPAHPGVPLAPPGIVPESDVRTHSPAAARSE